MEWLRRLFGYSNITPTKRTMWLKCPDNEWCHYHKECVFNCANPETFPDGPSESELDKRAHL